MCSLKLAINGMILLNEMVCFRLNEAHFATGNYRDVESDGTLLTILVLCISSHNLVVSKQRFVFRD